MGTNQGDGYHAIGSFKWKDTWSDEGFGIIAKSAKRPLLPALKQSNIIKIPGSNRFYDAEENFYDFLELTLTIQFVTGGIWNSDNQPTSFFEIVSNVQSNITPDPFFNLNYQEFQIKAYAIANWLGGGKWNTLEIFGDPKIYNAKIEQAIDLESMYNLGTADVPFTCLPFSYGEQSDAGVLIRPGVAALIPANPNPNPTP